MVTSESGSVDRSPSRRVSEIPLHPDAEGEPDPDVVLAPSVPSRHASFQPSPLDQGFRNGSRGLSVQPSVLSPPRDALIPVTQPEVRSLHDLDGRPVELDVATPTRRSYTQGGYEIINRPIPVDVYIHGTPPPQPVSQAPTRETYNLEDHRNQLRTRIDCSMAQYDKLSLYMDELMIGQARRNHARVA